jgi:hypothetical protein
MLLDPPNFPRLEHLAEAPAERILGPHGVGEEFIDRAVRESPRHEKLAATPFRKRREQLHGLRVPAASLSGTLLRLPLPLQAGYASLTRPTVNRVNPAVPP